jgi:N-acetylmuramic acid 6-phosphate (MurNAc-6-P) etherase
MKVSVALIMLKYNISRAEAARRLKSAHGIVRTALQG